ncbi:MAG: ornithine cyclodeaminase family protein [candidate division Zixibacteria bacterium]|nr:ornithine cyclodeaminase family protein [candidate division Zixibacteria bacterium]NIR67915.1 ornithine cyclodeaminase family protein [candidate division Zixibacteria bacterium]NIS16278.1 ornithine cyclodeaminase family protein [candidate division Zixibacteria bacterium]NIS49132.1 ornithine cyclodeaminase family protein [candidate division Zixibacteria bacterium]NIT53640.1 ornithine cyclodeaminase family protein [candidate division Zixibacteria bacterium]
MDTWIIKKSDITKVLDMQLCIDAVETSFRLYGQKKVAMPIKGYLAFESYNGDMRSMSAYFPDFPVAGTKTASVHPDNPARQMPTLMATIVLIDPDKGLPLAIMDGTYITSMRTGAAGGVAVKYLANDVVETIGFIGAGAQARSLLDAMFVVRPQIKKIKVYDIREDRAQAFEKYCRDNYEAEVELEGKISDAVRDCQIINTSTASRQPLFDYSLVSPGTHINAIGADAEGKQELSSSILKKSILVIDDWVEASHTGEINVPIHMGELNRSDIHAELAEIVTGQKEGRQSQSDITVFDSAGLAFQDIATAWRVYNLLLDNEDYKAQLLKINLME